MVFVTTDETDVLISALESLAEAKVERPFEILVVDNASIDNVAAQVEKVSPKAKVLRQDVRRGFSANLTLGFEQTAAPYLMICDADLLFEPGSVDNLADFLDENPRAGLVNPQLLSPEGEPRSSARRWYSLWTLAALKGPWRGVLGKTALIRLSIYADWDFSEPRSVDWVPFAGAMVRRKAVDEIGGPDPRFRLYFEDVDLSVRMHEAGWEVWNVPHSKVVHLENRASLRPFSRQWRWHLESLAKFWWKHRGLRPRRLQNAAG